MTIPYKIDNDGNEIYYCEKCGYESEYFTDVENCPKCAKDMEKLRGY